MESAPGAWSISPRPLAAVASVSLLRNLFEDQLRVNNTDLVSTHKRRQRYEDNPPQIKKGRKNFKP
jgi:hypothetical protein